MHRPATIATAPAEAAPPGFAGRILVAEDHPVNRAVIAHQLLRLGYSYELTENGEQAWWALNHDCFDLLITDCYMPVLDGYALARRIRRAEAGSDLPVHLPIVALSAVLPEQLRHCGDAGMDDFLAKPVQLHELGAKLAEHLGRRPDAAARAAGEPDDAPAPPDADPLEPLMRAFGPPPQLRKVLQGLLENNRRDLAALDQALRAGDVARQRELLHRSNGSLMLLGDALPAAPPAAATDDDGQRRNALAQRLDALERLLERLNRRHRASPPAAGDGSPA